MDGQEQAEQGGGVRKEGLQSHSASYRENGPSVDATSAGVQAVLQLSLSRVLAKRAHDGPELLGGDGAITVLVEQRESFFELGDLLLGQLLVTHGLNGCFCKGSAAFVSH